MATITHHKFKLSYLPPELHGAYICWSLIMKWMWWMQQNQLYTADPDNDDFFASATQNQQTYVQHHLAYLNDTSTKIHMLQKHPQVKNLFIKYNTVIPSSALVERLFSTASFILTKHRNRLSNSLFEKLLLLKANGGIYRLVQKIWHTFCTPDNFIKYWPIFKLFITVTVGRKFVIILSLKILLHLKYVATLPCEISVS